MVINLCQGVLCCQAFAMIYNLPVPMFFGTPNNLLVHSEVRWALPCSSAARVVALLPPPPAPFQLRTQELSVGTAAAATPWRRRGRPRLRRRQRSVDRSVGRWDEIAKQPAHKRGSRKTMLCYARRRRRWRTYRVTHHMTFTVRRGVSRRRRRRIPCCRPCTYRGCLLCTIRFSDKSKTLLFMRLILQHYDSSTYLLRLRQNAYTLPFARASYWCMKLHTYVT